MRHLTFVISGVLILALQAAAQVVPGRYILELSGEPAAAFALRTGHRVHAADAAFQSRRVALRQQHAQTRKSLEGKGAEVLGETTAVTNMIFVRFPSERAAELASIPGVVRVHPVLLYQLNLDHALPLLKVPEAWNQIGGPGNAGTGIKVAVIDTGIDPQHPAFQNNVLVAPAGFPKTNAPSDSIYTSNKIIVARSYPTNPDGAIAPATPTDGHGTGVAMIVAGAAITGPRGTISGIAPQAFLGNYKVFPDNPNSGAPTDAIISAINDAVSDGMDILTLSLGTALASRPPDDALVGAVEAATAAGKIVTVAAGNAGADPNTIGSPGTAPDAITVGSRPNDRVFGATVQADGMSPILAQPGSGTNSATPISGPISDVSQFDSTGLACAPLPAGSLAGSVALILRGICNFSDKLNNAQQAGAIAAIIYNDAARAVLFGMDVGTATLPATAVTYADGSALKQAAANGPINVTLGFVLAPVTVSINHLTGFSSRGPSSGNAIKPDLIAVGENVSSADLNSGFIVESGTSFSTPMVAGAAALLLAARPGLTTQQYRSLLINTAAPVIQDSGAPLTVQQEGSGFLNVFAAINGTVTAFPTSLSFGVGSGTFDQTTTLVLTNIGTASDTFAITTQPIGSGPVPLLSANTVQLAPGQSQNISVEFAGASLDPGAYQGYLQIQGTVSPVIATLPYWYGVPSDSAVTITVLHTPTSPAANSRQDILVRPTDGQGLDTSTPPTVTVTSGGGSVISVQSVDDQIPGAFDIRVRLGPRGTPNVFHVVSGSASTDITL